MLYLQRSQIKSMGVIIDSIIILIGLALFVFPIAGNAGDMSGNMAIVEMDTSHIESFIRLDDINNMPDGKGDYTFEPSFIAFQRTKDFSCVTETGCTDCPNADNMYFMPLGYMVTFPKIPVSFDGFSFQGSIGISGWIGTFDLIDVTATLDGYVFNEKVSYTLTLSGLTEYRPDPALFDDPIPFECTYVVEDAEWLKGTAVGEFESGFRVDTPPENCVALIYRDVTTGTATVNMTGSAPVPPVIDTVIDAGTGQDIYVKWSHPNPGDVGEYQAYIVNDEQTYSAESPLISENGSSEYSHVFGGLNEHENYTIRVRAHNLEGWSAYSEPKSIKPTVPVFLVHGLSDNASSWGKYLEWFAKKGYNHVYAVSTLAPCGTEHEKYYEGNASYLADYIETKLDFLKEKTGMDIEKVDLIGHSMGGLISRRYISPNSQGLWPQRKVRYLIMLGTPNMGSRLSDVPGAARIQCPTGPAVAELSRKNMIEFNENYHDNPETEYYIYWGSRGPLPTCYCGISSRFQSFPNDGAVTAYSAVRNQGILWNPYYKNNYGKLLPMPLWCHPDFFTDEWLFNTHIDPILRGQNPLKSAFSTMEDISHEEPQITYDHNCRSAGGETINGEFFLEGNDSATVALLSSDTTVSFSLKSPDGTIYDTTYVSTKDLCTGYKGLIGFTLYLTTVGKWEWVVDAAMVPSDIEVRIMSVVYNKVHASFTTTGTSSDKGDRAVIRAVLVDDAVPIAGATITVTPTLNDSTVLPPFSLFDDGQHDDSLANDGIYGADYEHSGDSGVVAFFIEAVGQASIGAFRRQETLYEYFVGSQTDIDDNQDGVLPNDFELERNRPNPFNAVTEIAVSLPEKAVGELTVYNILGQKVTTIYQGLLTAGRHTFLWDGNQASSGVYFVTYNSAKYQATRKMILLK